MELPNLLLVLSCQQTTVHPEMDYIGSIRQSMVRHQKKFVKKIPIPDLPFISPIIKRHSYFKNISITTSLTALWEFLKI